MLKAFIVLLVYFLVHTFQIWFSSRRFMYCPIIINNSWNSNWCWWKFHCWCERSLLGILKEFDKDWHDGILFRLKAYGVADRLLLLLKNYHESQEQRVVLNGHTSEWRKIKSGVPQGPLLFFNTRATFVFNIHKWSTWWNKFNV